MPKITKGHNSRSIFSKFLQKLIRLSSHHYQSIHLQGSSFNFFLDILLTRLHPYFFKGHNSEKGHNPDKTKIHVSYFFMRNPYKKFQNSSVHGSKVMLCIKKHDERTGGWTDEQPRSNMSLQLL